MKVGSLFAEIGFKVDQSGLDNFTKALKTFQKTVKDGLKDLKEYAKAAREISQAMRDAYMPTEKERQQRYRATTRFINANARKTNASAKYDTAVIRQMTARSFLDAVRAKFFEQDSNTRASNARSRERTLDLKERGLIGTHTGRYSKGLVQILRGIFGAQVGGIAGGIVGLAGAAHPIVAAIAIGVKAIVFAINMVMKTIREGVRTAMGYRDYMAFTGRSTHGIAGMMAAALNTTNMTPEDVMKDVAGFEKQYWDMFFGGGNPRAWQMAGILPTGNGEKDMKNILSFVWGASGGLQNRGLARSLLGQFGLKEDYIVLLEELKKRFPKAGMEEIFARSREDIAKQEEMNKTLREWDRTWKELKVELARIFIDLGVGQLLRDLVECLRDLVAWLKGFGFGPRTKAAMRIIGETAVPFSGGSGGTTTPITKGLGLFTDLLEFAGIIEKSKGQPVVINQTNNFDGLTEEQAGKISASQTGTLLTEHGSNIPINVSYVNA